MTLNFIADAWYFFKKNLVPLIVLIGSLLIPVNIFYALTIHYVPEIKRIEYLAMIPSLLVFPLYQCALILYISSVVKSEVISTKQYYQLALKLLFPLLGLYLLSTIAFITGLLLLIVPAIIIMVRFSFAEFYCVLYKKAPIEAFKLSWNATKEYKGVIFSGFIIIWLLTNIPFLITKKLFSSMELWNPVSIVLYHTAKSFFAILLTIFNFRIFSLTLENPENEKPY
ncbi:MAG: hypothetical protein B0W54_10640 [Cellvibrio sp. 79]|nr:MAG: hypothetical protein B0W54_10640 [Cellvibrio sp. 79]